MWRAGMQIYIVIIFFVQLWINQLNETKKCLHRKKVCTANKKIGMTNQLHKWLWFYLQKRTNKKV